MVAVQAPTPKRFSSDEFYRMGKFGLLDDRFELIDGEIIQLPPIGPEHASATTILYKILDGQLTAEYYVRDGRPLDLADSQPQPDLAIVKGNPSQYRTAHPTTAALVVELADSGLEYDQQTKLAVYARAGILDYWIVDLKARRLIVNRIPSGDRYADVKDFSSSDAVSLLELPNVTVAVADIF